MLICVMCNWYTNHTLSLSLSLSLCYRETIQSILEDAFESSIGQYDAYINSKSRDRSADGNSHNDDDNDNDDNDSEMDFETMLSLRKLKGIELTILENNKNLPYVGQLSGKLHMCISL